MPPPEERAHPPAWLLSGVALGLFLIWSNSFVAIGYLVGADRDAARLDWAGLTAARFLPVLPAVLVYCLGFHARESLTLLRAHPRRLIVAGLLAVPGYNVALAYGQQNGVPAPIASLTTALLPLFVLTLAAIFLGERLTRRRIVGFLVSLTGMALVASARGTVGGTVYAVAILVTALAPLSWSIFSVISKPVTRTFRPLLWAYLAVLLGTLATLPVLAVPGVRQQLLDLDRVGWLAVLYLSYPCTVLGYALWVRLLRSLPASTVGMSVFLNPPLTTTSKVVLAAVFPAVFAFTVTGRELLGGGLALLGLLIAVFRR